MPEIFRTETNEGFISIWKLSESVDFLRQHVNESTVKLLESKFDFEKRLCEKYIPHFVLKSYDNTLTLNNVERQPFLNNGFISVSHCKNYVATMFDWKNSVGIDIEYFGERILKILHKFLNAEEAAFCNKDSKKSLIIWAAKEAIFKKFGGDTAFFQTTIYIHPFEEKSRQELNATVIINQKNISCKLMCELFEEFVLVYTI